MYMYIDVNFWGGMGILQIKDDVTMLKVAGYLPKYYRHQMDHEPRNDPPDH